MERINPMVYRIRLPDNYPMHPVLNLEHLRKYHVSPPEFGERTKLPDTRDYLQPTEEYVVEAILGHAIKPRKDGNQRMFRTMSVAPVNTNGHARFAHTRLPCLAGYRGLPGIYTAMSFDLRHLPRITSRLVKMDGHIYELWSPNSTQLPFLPGTPRPDWLPVIPKLLAERRYDGHAGKHDCLHAPQYHRRVTKHWPFMRRASMVQTGDYAELAYVPVSGFWQCDDLDKRRGHLDPSFIQGLSALRRLLDLQMETFRELAECKSRSSRPGTLSDWELRPAYASEGRIAHLLGVRYWDEAVDLVVAVQRGLREKEAWLHLFEVRNQQRRLSFEELRREEMPMAKEKFMGFWVNGMDEEPVLRHMRAGVPCFIVHEYVSSSSTREEVGDVKIFHDFLEGTETLERLGDNNPYQQLARQQGALDNIALGDDGRGLQLPALATDEMRSSSLYLEQLAPLELPPLPPRAILEAQEPQPSAAAPSEAAPLKDWRPYSTSQVPSGPRPLLATSWQPSGRAAPAPPRLDYTTLPLPMPAASAPTSTPPTKADKYLARPLEYRSLDPQRSPWIVPPPIQKAKDKGKWTKFELDEVHGLPAFVRRGADAQVESSSLWYDRDNKRRLYFGHFVPPAGVVDEDHFGAPVPRHPFFAEDGNRWAPQPPSSWMYSTQDSPRYNVGKRAVAPAPSRLPLLNNADRAREEEMKGKGKAATTAEYESEEDEYGMVVDVPDPVEAPSCVVVVDGLDELISAVGFVRLARDAFYAGRATPRAVIRAQGQMWMRFGSITQGRGAFGALGSVAYGIGVRFRPEAEFEERLRYTTDVWYPDSDVDSPTQDVTMRDASAVEETTASAGSSAIMAASPPSTDKTSPLTSPSTPVLTAPRSPSLDTQRAEPSAPALTMPDVEQPPTPSPVVSPRAIPPSPASTPAPSAQPPTAPVVSPRAIPPSSASTPAPFAQPPTAPRAMRDAAPLPRKMFLGDRLTSAAPKAPLLPPGPTTPLLRRIEGGRVPLAQRLADPSQPLAERLQAPPLLDRLGGSLANLLPLSEDLRSTSAEQFEREEGQLEAAQDSATNQDDVQAPGKGKRKVRRGNRAGKLAREQARLKEERRALAQQEMVATASPDVAIVAPIPQPQNAVASSSAVTLDVVAPLPAIEAEEATWNEYALEAFGSFSAPPVQMAPSPPPLPESGPPGADAAELIAPYEEEDVALRWDDGDDEDRPYAGPF
ncbi:hypothetical protein C8R47DRAFT_1212798 [Mycena vitilis]|nr:hypothetical protein C8R47DRAFT_1212798 [Mycena vitilis]